MNGQVNVAQLLENLHLAVDEAQRRVWAVNCAHALGLDGMAVSLAEELVWFSDATSARLEDMQFVLGQGPGLLLPEGEGVREISDVDRLLMRHWPQFVPEAQALSVAAVFVWPVHVGAAPIGTLTGYRRTTGALSDRQRSEGWMVADTLAAYMLERWPGTAEEQDGPGHAGAVDLHRAEVHQATGVLSVRLDTSLSEALAWLRAQTYSSGRSLSEVAHAVLAEELPS